MKFEFRNICELLKSEHLYIKDLFAKYANSINDESLFHCQLDLAYEICSTLSIHSKLETELLFPAITNDINTTLETRNFIMDAYTKHQCVGYSIMKIKKNKMINKLLDARVILLSENIDKLIEIEERRIFNVAGTHTLD